MIRKFNMYSKAVASVSNWSTVQKTGVLVLIKLQTYNYMVFLNQKGLCQGLQKLLVFFI